MYAFSFNAIAFTYKKKRSLSIGMKEIVYLWEFDILPNVT